QRMVRAGITKAMAIIAVLALWASGLAFAFEKINPDEDRELATAEQAADGAETDGAGGADGAGGGAAGDGSGSGGEGSDSGTVEASGKVEAREPGGVEVRLRSVSLVEEISEGA